MNIQEIKYRAVKKILTSVRYANNKISFQFSIVSTWNTAKNALLNESKLGLKLFTLKLKEPPYNYILFNYR